MADDLTTELRDYIYRMYADTPFPERKRCRWVMSLEWLNEVRKVDADINRRCGFPAPSASAMPETILGLPIEVREDAGAPWLEAAPAA